jgi:hypothetical protein
MYLTSDSTLTASIQAVLTIISSVYLLVVEYNLPAGYNYWAVLGLDVFFVVMWLIAFALLTSQVAPVFGYDSYTYTSSGYISVGLSGFELTWSATQITAAALGGVQL